MIPRFVISQVVREMVVLELAPTIMAIIYAGKIGSSMAGGIGTMRITEQIDALEVMGINSSSYLVLPKNYCFHFDVSPTSGSNRECVPLWAVTLLATFINIITPTEYVSGLRFGFNDFEIIIALTKSFIFAFLIASISSFKGYFTKGGALEVGIASTEAVTTSVIAVLLADYFIVNIMLR